MYSPYLLAKVLPNQHFKNWMLFADACRLLVKPSIKNDEIEESHQLLIQFCKGCEKLYSRSFITPNMHLHGYLRDVLYDYGPVYAFWLFSFERYNDLLGNIDTNKKMAFEVTFAKCFLEQAQTADYLRSIEHLLTTEQRTFLADLVKDPLAITTTTHLSSLDAFHLEEFIQTSEQIIHATGSEPLPLGAIPEKTKSVRMAPEYHACLMRFYGDAYGDAQHRFCDAVKPIPGHIAVGRTIRYFTSIRLHGQLYGSAEAQIKRGSHIQALFLEKGSDDAAAFPGQVLYYFQHEVTIKGKTTAHTFAMVRWYDYYRSAQPSLDADLEVSQKTFRPLNRDSVLPVHRRFSPIAVTNYKDARLLLVIPMQKKIYA